MQCVRIAARQVGQMGFRRQLLGHPTAAETQVLQRWEGMAPEDTRATLSWIKRHRDAEIRNSVLLRLHLLKVSESRPCSQDWDRWKADHGQTHGQTPVVQSDSPQPLTTADVFTTTEDLPSQDPYRWQALCKPIWLSEVATLNRQVTAQMEEDACRLSEALSAPLRTSCGDHEDADGILALLKRALDAHRPLAGLFAGPVGSGKTRAVIDFLRKINISETFLSGVLAPDRVKAALRQVFPGVTARAVHEQSSLITADVRRLLQTVDFRVEDGCITPEKVPPEPHVSVIFDRTSTPEHAANAVMARPLTGNDPRLPFCALAESHYRACLTRLELLQRLSRLPVGYYSLAVYNPLCSTKRVQVYISTSPGPGLGRQEWIGDVALFDSIRNQRPGELVSQLSRLGDTVITPGFIESQKRHSPPEYGHQIEENWRRYKGCTVAEAFSLHTIGEDAVDRKRLAARMLAHYGGSEV